MHGTGGPVAVAEQDSQAVTGAGTEIDADAVAVVPGAGQRFIDAIEGIEGRRTHPPGHRELINRAYLAARSEIGSASQAEFVCGAKGGIGGRCFPGDTGGADQGPVVASKRINDPVTTSCRFIESVVGHQVSQSRGCAWDRDETNCQKVEEAAGRGGLGGAPAGRVHGFF